MERMEPSEREIIIRTDNQSDVWDVYVVKGATGERTILKHLENVTEDAHGYRGTLPKRSGLRFGKIQRQLTEEWRQQMSERMKKRHAKTDSEHAEESPFEFPES